MATSTRKRPPSRRAQATSSKLPLVLGGLAVLLVAIVIATLTASDSGSAVAVEDIAGSPRIATDPLPAFQGDPATDQAQGQRAVEIEGQSVDGDPVVIGQTGQPQLLLFLASWCPACQAELPEVVEWLEAGHLPDEVELTAVVTGLDRTRPNWPPTDWLEREGYEGRTIVDDADGSIAAAYGMSGTPFWVAVDGDAQVVARTSGRIPMEVVGQWADALSRP